MVGYSFGGNFGSKPKSFKALPGLCNTGVGGLNAEAFRCPRKPDPQLLQHSPMCAVVGVGGCMRCKVCAYDVYICQYAFFNEFRWHCAHTPTRRMCSMR